MHKARQLSSSVCVPSRFNTAEVKHGTGLSHFPALSGALKFRKALPLCRKQLTDLSRRFRIETSWAFLNKLKPQEMRKGGTDR